MDEGALEADKEDKGRHLDGVRPMNRAEGLLRRRNSLAIALLLGVLAVLFYAVTIVRLQGNVAKRMSFEHAGGKSTVTEPVSAPGATTTKSK